MSIRAIKGWLYYRFQYRGQRPEVSTGLEDTPRNRKLVAIMEADHKKRLIQGRFGLNGPEPIGFRSAFEAFIAAVKVDRADKPNTYKRIETSGASLKTYFGSKTVYLLTTGDAENYKRWRISGVKNAEGEWEIKPVKRITVRHDMDNLSLFFQWAKKRSHHKQSSRRRRETNHCRGRGYAHVHPERRGRATLFRAPSAAQNQREREPARRWAAHDPAGRATG